MKHEIKRRSIYSDGLEERRLEYFSHGRYYMYNIQGMTQYLTIGAIQ